MHPFISSLGKLVGYTVPAPSSPVLIRPDPATYDEETVETDKRRVYLRLHCGGTLRISFKDPNDPDFTPAYWVDVTPLAGGTDGYELWYTGDVWADGNEDVMVVSGY